LADGWQVKKELPHTIFSGVVPVVPTSGICKPFLSFTYMTPLTHGIWDALLSQGPLRELDRAKNQPQNLWQTGNYKKRHATKSHREEAPAVWPPMQDMDLMEDNRKLKTLIFGTVKGTNKIGRPCRG